jgi:hypothetical protein
MRHEERQELKPAEQLVVGAQRGVVVAAVKDASIIEIAQTAQGHGRAHQVLKQRLELTTLASRPFPVMTLYFRLKGPPGTSTPIWFCDRDFSIYNVCFVNYLYSISPSGEHLIALSTRHRAGELRILPGEPTRPSPT